MGDDEPGSTGSELCAGPDEPLGDQLDEPAEESDALNQLAKEERPQGVFL